MATPGFGGKLLLVNLTNKQITTLDTEKYEQFGGGHGIATALFWDYCVAPGDWDMQDAFHPKNMVALVTGPVSGTGVPWAGKDQGSFGAVAPVLSHTVVRAQQLRRHVSLL